VWYSDRGCRATYVGHPYFDEMQRQQHDPESDHALSDCRDRLVTILPGSRTQEVTANLSSFLDAASHIRDRIPDVRFAIAAFNDKQARIATELTREVGFPVEIHVGKTAGLIRSADCCMACSGSVSLELLYHEKPTVILYRVTRLAYVAQHIMRRVKYITLVNLLASRNPFPRDLSTYDPDRPDGERVPFPEYLTFRDVAPRMAAHITGWLTHPDQRAGIVTQLRHLKEQFAHAGASSTAAGHILSHLPVEGASAAERWEAA